MIKQINKSIRECKKSLREDDFTSSHQEGFCEGFVSAMEEVKKRILEEERVRLTKRGSKK